MIKGRLKYPKLFYLLSSEAKHNKGFTLLEVLVSTAILGIAITVVFQLFSANLRAVSASKDYVFASAKAEAKMREALDSDELEAETSWGEVTNDGYKIDVSVKEILEERTENLQVRLLEIALTIRWTSGTAEKSQTLRTIKAAPKKI